MSNNSIQQTQAFSDERYQYDSSMFIGSIVEHTTSWLTVNPYKGCPLRCAYCFRVKWGASNIATPQIDVEKAMDIRLNHPDFIPHITPVSVNVSSTDALLPAVRRSTFEAIEFLEKRELANPFGITTKLEFADSEIAFLESLKHVRPVVFISLAFIPRSIEPISTQPRIRNLQALSETRVPTVHYFRPIVEGWNDSDEIIEKALLIGDRYADAICIGSIRLSTEIRSELSKVGVELEKYVDNFHEKKFRNAIEERVLRAHSCLRLDVPLFKHTSCAVSYFMNIKNYNRLYKRPEKNCLRTCPLAQQARCRPGQQ